MYDKVYHFLLVIVLLIMPLTDCGEDVLPCQNGTIYPQNPYVLAGQEITLTCVINTTARHLTFTRGPESKLVNEMYIQRLNSSAIKMVLPNTEDINIHEQRYMFFRCEDYYEDKMQMCHKSVLVEMEYFPVQAKNISCRVYGWREMNCTWDLAIKYVNESKVDVKCEVSSSLPISSSKKSTPSPCPQQNRNWSYWNIKDFYEAMSYTIIVIVKNKVTNDLKTSNYTFLLDDVVEPSAVKNLKLKISENRSCVIVSWKMPNDRRGRFLCIISYQSECHSGEQTIDSCNGTMPKNETICGLSLNVSYIFSVVCQQIKCSTKFAIGYFSKPVSKEIFSPICEAPWVSPETTEGPYDDKNIYQKPFNACELHVTSLKYIISNGNESKVENHPSVSSSLLLPKSWVNILAENDCGSANKTSALDIFSKDTAPNKSDLTIGYNISGNCSNVFAMIIEDDSNNGMFSNISHTIVWCQETVTCERPIQWRVLETKETTFQHCNKYQYDLITKGLHKDLSIMTNTGIVWRTCLYEIGKVPEKPLMSNLPAYQGPGSVRIEWKHYKCEEAGYVTHYLVTYCHRENTNSHSCVCGENSIKINVSNHQKVHEVTNLKAGTHICIWVEAIMRKTMSQLPIKSSVHTIKNKDVTDVSYVNVISVVMMIMALAISIGIFCIVRKWNTHRKNLEKINMNMLGFLHSEYQDSPTADLSEIDKLLSKSDTNSNAEDTSGIGTSTFQRSESGTNRDHWNNSSTNRHRTSHLNIPPLKMPISVNKHRTGSYGNPLFKGMVPGPKGQRNSSEVYASDLCLNGYNQATDVELNYGVTDTTSVISDGIQISMEKSCNITYGNSNEICSKDKCVKKQSDFDREEDDESINLNKEENGKFEMQCNSDSILEAKECDDRPNTKCVNNSDLNINDCGDTKFNVMLPEAKSCKFIIQNKFHQSNEMMDKICDKEDGLSNESEYLSVYKTCLNAAESADDLCETSSSHEKLYKAMKHSKLFRSQDSSMRNLSANYRISDIQNTFKDQISNDKRNIDNGELSTIISDSLSENEDTLNNSKPTLKNYTNVKSLDLSAIDLNNSNEVSLEECETDDQISNTECKGVMKHETNEFPEMLLYENMKTREDQKEPIVENNKGTDFVVCNSSNSSYSFVTVDNIHHFLKADTDMAFKNKLIIDRNRINGTTVINGLKNS